MAHMDKKGLRRLYRGVAVAEDISRATIRILMEDELIRKAGLLLLYWPMNDEIDIRPLFGCGIPTALPYMVDDRNMEFALYDGRLSQGRHGLMEPAERRPLEPADDSIMLIPALAYDREGYRLGRGMGCYDRYLAHRKLFTIGVVPSSRLLAVLPHDDHDIRVNMLACEDGIEAAGR